MIKTIAEILQEKIRLQPEKKHSRGTEWTDMVQQFQKELNRERKPPYRPLSYMAIRNKVSHLDIGTLYWFFSTCKDYRARNKGEFGKCFFGSLKIDK